MNKTDQDLLNEVHQCWKEFVDAIEHAKQVGLTIAPANYRDYGSKPIGLEPDQLRQIKHIAIREYA